MDDRELTEVGTNDIVPRRPGVRPIYDHEGHTVRDVTGRTRRTRIDDGRGDRVARRVPGRPMNRVQRRARRSLLDPNDRGRALLVAAAQPLSPHARDEIFR